MKYISIFSAIFLLALFFFIWGVVAAEYEKFPWALIDSAQNEIAAIFKGGEAREKALKRLKHETGLWPEKMMGEFKKSEKRSYRSVDIAGLRKRRQLGPLLFSGTESAISGGYLIIWGAFDFEQDLHGAILMDEKGNVINKWIPDREALKEMIKERAGSSKGGKAGGEYEKSEDLPQGYAVFSDGSVLFNDGDPGNGMQKLAYDSESVWVKPGEFNHFIAKQKQDSVVWTIESDHTLHKINVDTGSTLEKLMIEEIMLSNPDMDVLSLRYDDFEDQWFNDRWHLNDADPLPEAYADEFSGFRAGDLLLSLRSLNALMVVDPVSQKIKWFKIGEFSRQHDPDWQKNGTITVYDNRPRDVYGDKKIKDTPPRFSRILEINPETDSTKILYDGEKDGFYSRIRGKHQVLPNGNILITSSGQGRVLVVNPRDETVFEFINSYSGDEVLFVSEAIWVPHDFFDFDPEKKDS
ncbi:MAG: arylsulfotransferase family protein [Desulfobacterales bacterium]